MNNFSFIQNKMLFKNLPAVALVFLLLSCGSEGDEKEKNQPNKPTGENTTEVKVISATRKPFEYPIQAQGKIESVVEAKVFCRTTGLIKQILVTNKQYVKKRSGIGKAG